MTTRTAPRKHRDSTTRVEVARHMIDAGWGVAIFRHENGEHEVVTVARMGDLGLRSHPLAWEATEEAARAAANREWLNQKRDR